MIEYRLLCYRDSFKAYKNIANDIIRAIPARDHDEFALIVCVSASGEIGFHSTIEAGVLLGKITCGTYTLVGERLQYVPIALPEQSRKYAFKPKNNVLQAMIKEHEKYELDVKKYQILKRNGRPCSLPKPARLTSFLKERLNPINIVLYNEIIESCYYVTQKVGSGEHGFGAFEVFSDNLDVFFDDLKRLMDETGELIFVDHSQIPYH